MEKSFEKRIAELYERSRARGIFVYTPFLSLSEQAETTAICGNENVSFYGGAEFAERRIARFGNAEELGYDEDPPIALLKISCRAGKFASSLSHRDYLGAILNLGIEREKIGDIFVNGQFCYVVTTEIPAETIKRELCRVGREQVVTESAEEIPETFAPKTEEKEIIVSSYRTDVFVCAVWNLSRSDGQKLFEKQFVSVDGKVPGGGDKELKRGAVVTARGYGKFRVGETLGKTKKNNFAVKIERYV